MADGAAPDGGGDGDGGGGGGGGSSGGGVGSGGDGRDIERGGTPNRDSATPDPEGKKGPKLYLITQVRKFYIFSRVHATLQVTPSVRRSVGLSPFYFLLCYQYSSKQVYSDNDASKVCILGHFATTWDNSGQLRKTF